MKLSDVRLVLEQAGYAVQAITEIAEGSNHDVFDILLQNGRPPFVNSPRCGKPSRA